VNKPAKGNPGFAGCVSPGGAGGGGGTTGASPGEREGGFDPPTEGQARAGRVQSTKEQGRYWHHTHGRTAQPRGGPGGMLRTKDPTPEHRPTPNGQRATHSRVGCALLMAFNGTCEKRKRGGLYNDDQQPTTSNTPANREPRTYAIRALWADIWAMGYRYLVFIGMTWYQVPGASGTWWDPPGVGGPWFFVFVFFFLLPNRSWS
jgi:hypothetical protein